MGKKGIGINGEYLNNLRFADDVILIAKSHKELQEMVEELINMGEEAGLEMNLGKTVYITNNDKVPKIRIKQQQLEKQDEAIYLGQLISTKDKA